MNYYLAPMEGITGYIFRNACHSCFYPMDKYFTPFIVAKTNAKKNLNYREYQDILPEHNRGMYTVPQILTNRAEDFVVIAKELQEFGYKEINLNLGCPSRTVVSKGRGSGFLDFPEELDAFLEKIFDSLDIKISIKTRIGVNVPDEFEHLLEIYNHYPLEELIIHPRVQKDYYKSTPNWDAFRSGYEQSLNPVCYNGDIFTAKDYQSFEEAFPKCTRVMIGRGLLYNPGLVQELVTGRAMDKQQLRRFHDQLYRDYQDWVSGDKNLLFKLKELWSYLSDSFKDSAKFAKKIRKAERLCVYDEIVNQMFEELELSHHKGE